MGPVITPTSAEKQAAAEAKQIAKIANTRRHAAELEIQLKIIRARRMKKEGRFARSGNVDMSPEDIATAFLEDSSTNEGEGESTEPHEEIGEMPDDASMADFLDSYDGSTAANAEHSEMPGASVERNATDDFLDSLGNAGADETRSNGASNISGVDDFLSSLDSPKSDSDEGDGPKILGENRPQETVQESLPKALPRGLKPESDLENLVLPPELQKLLKDIRGI